MPQFTQDGVIYEELPNGQVRVVGYQDAPASVVPSNPARAGQQARENARGDANVANDAVRTGIAVRGEGRDVKNTLFDQSKKLRDEFSTHPRVKAYETVIGQYGRALNVGDNPSGDQSLINAYAQMLNPTSTVTAGEYDSTAQLDPTLQQVKTRLMREFGWDGAGRISPKARGWIKDEMLGIAKSANKSYRQTRAFYDDLAAKNGFDPYDVTGHHAGEPYFKQIEQDILSRKKANRPAANTTSGQSAWPGVFDENGAPLGPDGGIGYDQSGKEMGLYGSVTDDGTLQGSAGSGPSYQSSQLGQGMSGVNNGLANTVGLPVDLITMGINAIPAGINSLANTDLPTVQNPVMGSNWVKDKMRDWAIYKPNADGSGQFARRVGESIGAAIVPLGASGSLAAAGKGLFGAVGGGIGAAAANQAFPNNPVADFAGDLIGGGIATGGIAAFARNAAQRKIESAIPTVEQLKDQASSLYKQAESRGITADPAMTQQLADNLRQTLKDQAKVTPVGRISDTAPKVKEAMQLVDDYAGFPMNPRQIETVRRIVADGMGSADATERRLSSLMTDEFDNWAIPQAPELAQARDISSRYLNAQKLEQARELARANTSLFSQSGFENALRNQYRAIDRNAVKGKGRYGDDLTASIENVSRGSMGANLSRGIGKYAPTSPIPTLAGGGIGAVVGGALGGPGGALAGGALMSGAGHLGRKFAERATTRAADVAELTARNGGAINQAPYIDDDMKRAITAIVMAQGSNALPSLNKYQSEERNQTPKNKRGIFGKQR